MKSTGEVMGLDRTFPLAYAKSQIEADTPLPLSGSVFISVRDSEKEKIVPVAKVLSLLGFGILTTAGTGARLQAAGITATIVPKLAEAQRPNILDYMKNREVSLLINTPSGPAPRRDETTIRATAVNLRIPLITTVAAAVAAARAIEALRNGEFEVYSLQDVHAQVK
jgi:carbamoyl-phosphate synthase large subunit